MAEGSIECTSQEEWRKWLEEHHGKSEGVWLRLGKKGSKAARVTYAEALDVALCYGWIDGQRKPGDEQFFLVRFAPRGKRSIWSKINREHVARLMETGEMRRAGLAEVERAKSDGRWDQAYDPASRAEVPPDLQEALARNPKAKAFFATLDRQNRYAVLFRIQTVKRPETRARKINEFVQMLAEGRKIHP